MRKFLPIFLLIMALGPFMSQAQSVVLSEDFEGTTFSVTSSGTPGWSLSSTLYNSGSKSDSTKMVNPGDSSVLTTNVITTTGNPFVLLEFDHICKIEFFDACEIYVSPDNGTTWTKLTDAEYIGTASFGPQTGNKFTSAAYADWLPGNPTPPSNTWWKHEKFDISTIAGNSANVLVSFVFRDLNNTTQLENLGWFIDDIKITMGPAEIFPPVISLNTPIIQDTVYNLGPYPIIATITDGSGIDTAMVIYTKNNLPADTVGMVSAGNTFMADIPVMAIGDSVCYYVYAEDASALHNSATEPGMGCVSFVVATAPPPPGCTTPVTVFPIFEDFETNAIVNWTQSTTDDMDFTVQSGGTGSSGTGPSGAYDGTYYIYTEASGNNNKTCEIIGECIDITGLSTPVLEFYYHMYGVNMGSLSVDIYYGGQWVNDIWTISGDQGQSWHKAEIFLTAYKSITQLRIRAITGTGYESDICLDNIKVWQPPANDAGLTTVWEPVTPALSGTNDVKVVLKNFGSANLTSVDIDWELSGTAQTTYNWTGTLAPGYTDTVTIGSPSFVAGSTNIKAWTTNPNNATDGFTFNDTAVTDVIFCDGWLSGTYTIGGLSADYIDFSTAINALNVCGVDSAVVFLVNPGTYNEQLTIGQAPGVNSVNTVTFKGQGASTILEYASTDNAARHVVKFDASKNITFDSIYVRAATGSSYGWIFHLKNFTDSITIKNCIIEMPVQASDNYAGIVGSNSDTYFSNGAICNHMIATGNTITGGNYGIRAAGPYGAYTPEVIIENNTVIDAGYYGIYAYYVDSSRVCGNTVTTSSSSTSWSQYGIYAYYMNNSVVDGNNIKIYGTNSSLYGLYTGYLSSLTSTKPTYVTNNMVYQQGGSGSSIYGLYTYYCPNAIYSNNSIKITGSGGSTHTACYVGGWSTGANMKFFNNIYAHYGGGAAFEITTTPVSNNYVTESDNNCYYSTGAIAAKWGGASILMTSGPSSLTAINGMDTASLFVDPSFLSVDDLHSNSANLNDAGLPLSYVPFDIDGEPRDTVTPDIGADEFTPPLDDMGVIAILEPLAVDTEGVSRPVVVIIKNFGLDTATAATIDYSVNGGTSVSQAWTGSLATAETDTVTLANMTIPGADYSLCAWTTTSGDIIDFNDTTCVSYFGLPLIDAGVIAIESPTDGCGLTSSETVEVWIKNFGLDTIQSGLSASYQVNANTAVTEAVTPVNLAPGDSMSFAFTTTADFSVTTVDSVFGIAAWTVHASDPLFGNDTVIDEVKSLHIPYDPIVSDTTIPYATTVTLNATATDSVYWFADDTTTVELHQGASYTTPILYDSTTYYAAAITLKPPVEVQLGTGTITNGTYGYPAPYGNYYKGAIHQFLIPASELQALGLEEGNISAIGFDVDAVGGAPLSNFSIKVGTTTQSDLQTWETGLTSVYSVPSYTDAVGWNMHYFQIPFLWDGVSNLVIETCFNNYPAQYTTNASFNQTSTSYVSSRYRQTDSDPVLCAGGAPSTSNSSMQRPNMKIIGGEAAGCESNRLPVNVHVTPPAVDLDIVEFVSPTSGCGLANSDVEVKITHYGVDTITSGATVAFQIDANPFITAEPITQTIYPGDTINFVFATQALLPAVFNDSSYVITAVVAHAQDAYAGNDSIVSDTIVSLQTPDPPIVTSPYTATYATSISIAASSPDTCFWWDEQLAGNQLHVGNTFITPVLYDTANFFVEARAYVPGTLYDVTTANPTASSSYPVPYGNSWDGNRAQFLILASELSALGMGMGDITSVGFDVVSTSGATTLDNFEVKIGATMSTSLSTWESGLTTVYSTPSFTEVTGWSMHPFATPFSWDGVSNIVVEVCNYNAPYTYTSNGSVNKMTTPFTSSVYYYADNNATVCTNGNQSGTSNQRPVMRIEAVGLGTCASQRVPVTVNVTGFPNVDAGLETFVSPSGSAQGGTPYDVKVELKNYGLNALTSADITWSVDGVVQNTYNWTGTLNHGDVAVATIATNHVFVGGLRGLKAWVDNPNSTTGTVALNDTIVDSISVCMSGTYTIGDSTKDYQSFTEAINTMNVATVCGPITFLVDSGTYNEQIIIPEIVGVSDVNTVTFTSANGDSSSVVLQYACTASDNYVVLLDGADYYTFSHMTMKAFGGSYGRVVVFDGGCDNNIFTNNEIVTVPSTSYQVQSAGFFWDNTVNNNNQILNNNIMFGNRAISFRSSSSSHSTGTKIIGNTLGSNYQYSIYSYYNDSTEISHNTINVVGTNYSMYGIYAYYNNSDLVIKNNDITCNGTNGNYGIYVSYNGGTPNSIVANNTVAIHSGYGNAYGIYAYQANDLKVYYNSVYITAGGSSYAGGLYTSYGANLDIRNNIFTNYGQGPAMYINTTSAIDTMDYNNYYTPASNTNFVYFGATVADLATLKLFDPSKNVNSISVDPDFFGINDLHTVEISLNGAAQPVPEITTDFDGELRDATNPDIGADEFTPAPIDLGGVNVVYPVASGCGLSSTDSIIVRIKNYGLNTLDFALSNATITLNVTGIVTQTINFTLNTGTLTSGDVMDVKISNNFDFSVAGAYNFNGNVTIASDGNSQNNPIEPKSIVSYPSISTFPFTENFESGINLTFVPNVGTEAALEINSDAASASSLGMMLSGGTSSGFSTPYNVTDAFNTAHQTHITEAVTCNIDASNVTALKMKFDHKMQYSYNSNYGWFRVMVNGNYAKDVLGDSVWQANNSTTDPWNSLIFDLTPFVGGPIVVSLESSMKYYYQTGSGNGDNVFIDNFTLWEPDPYDIAVIGFAKPDPNFGPAGMSNDVWVVIENFGSNTIQPGDMTLSFNYNNSTTPITENYGFSLAPNMKDTFKFVATFTPIAGAHELMAWADLTGDAVAVNDTTKTTYTGIPVLQIPYADDLEGTAYFVGQGSQNVWQLGAPAAATINSAHSGNNAWVTNLLGDYPDDAQEFLYTPYFDFSTLGATDTASIDFWAWMDVQPNSDFGEVQYTNDGGQNWASIGYMDPNNPNWYDAIVGGLHVFSASNTGWQNKFHQLDPTTFNTPNPVQFRFKFTSDMSVSNYEGWAIDDFAVTLPPKANDVGVASINYPVSDTAIGSNVNVQVTLENFGTNPQTNFPVVLKIDNAPAITETFTGTVAPLGGTATFTFTTPYVVPLQAYNMDVYTNLTNDGLNNNDTASAAFGVLPAANDVGVSVIVSPNVYPGVDTLFLNATSPYDLTVRIKNYGTVTQTSIPVEYQIGTNSPIIETWTGSLGQGDSIDHTFSTPITVSFGYFTVYARTTLMNDVVAVNDEDDKDYYGTFGITEGIVDGFKLYQNVPNPATYTTTVSYEIPAAGTVNFSIVDLYGRQVYNESVNTTAGMHSVVVGTSNLAAGTYYYFIEYEGMRLTRKMVITK